MKRLEICATKLAGMLAAALLVTSIGAARTLSDGSSPGTFLKGYVRALAGEQIDYNCFNPLATTALLTRCTTGQMDIEWETEPIPADAKEDFVSFKWIVSYSTTTSAGDRSFDFLINGKKTFVIKTRKGVNEKEWSLTAGDSSVLSFQFVREDFAHDANGYMYLKVPVARFSKGEPLRLRVVGEHANSNDWFMTFMYDLRTVDVQVLPLPYLTLVDNALHQTVCVAITSLGETGKATIAIGSGNKVERKLQLGENDFEFQVPAVQTEKRILLRVAVDGSPEESYETMLHHISPRTIYLLPHAHNDIGYTDIQTEVLKKQVKNIYDALDLIKKTASYPPEARFKWNIEVSWSVETFMQTATPAKRKEFLDALKNGSICLEGLYANVLTGIMRPEEFFRLTEFSRSLKARYGITVTTAMISDVPGMTWNMIPTLAQAGIRYFSSGPNGMYSGGDRTGYTDISWADRPFYWTSPSGNERILYWMTGYGYGSPFAEISGQNGGRLRFLKNISHYFQWLDRISYPYDMIQMRYTFNGDNGTVDPNLPQLVRSWNETHVSPKIAIATTESLFRQFEQKYGSSLPAFTGDFTPYWEDGAASTAKELGINRRTSEQLVQTEALAAIIAPVKYDSLAFYDAWKNVLLFDEHTWGAYNSTADPDSPFVIKQWNIKQAFAVDGAKASEHLRDEIVGKSSEVPEPEAFDIINTNSWERTDLVILPRLQSLKGDVVKDQSGTEVPSQRLSNGDLAFLAERVPALGAKRYSLYRGPSTFKSRLTIENGTLSDGNFQVTLDTTTGTITRLRTLDPSIEYVDTAHNGGLDEYFYVAGFDAREALESGKAHVAIREHGPLVASFVVTSDAPGCNSLTREFRMISGTGRLDIINTVDKKKVRTNEAVHFGFPFAVPDGVVRIDLGFGVIRPESDQLPGSCKDYFSTQRWADVSNQDYGITLTVSEAPLLEVGDLHSELPSPRKVDWKRQQYSSPRLASYVMNNYWYTNYKADQEGVSSYHYSIIPHGLYNQSSVVRAGIERSQPLIVRPVAASEAEPKPPFRINPGGAIVTYLKPVNHGRGYLVRLFNAGGYPEVTTLTPRVKTQSVYLSSPLEERGKRIDTIELPAYGIATVRIE